MRTAVFSGGPGVLHQEGVQQSLAASSQYSSPLPLFWLSALWAAWCSRTPSVRPATLSASPAGSWAWDCRGLAVLSSSAASSALPGHGEAGAGHGGALSAGGTCGAGGRIRTCRRRSGMIFRYAFFVPNAIIGGGRAMP